METLYSSVFEFSIKNRTIYQLGKFCHIRLALKYVARPVSIGSSASHLGWNELGFLRSIMLVEIVRMIRRSPCLVARATAGKYVGISGPMAVPTATGKPFNVPSLSIYLM